MLRNGVPLSRKRSADRDQGNFFFSFIGKNEHSFGVQHRHAIHQKLVVVMAIGQKKLKNPRAIRLSIHRLRGRIPTIEIANKADRSRKRGLAPKANRFASLPGLMVEHDHKHGLVGIRGLR
jgi:hypothetical protein